MSEQLIIFVHGYSVSSFETYGELPARLQLEAQEKRLDIQSHSIFLARYISFNDEVRLDDLAAALETALRQEVYSKYSNRRFVCITHSTGGPLVRNWRRLYYPRAEDSPMSHLVMLAPANHGSALAQLGKSRLGKVRSLFSGMEPGKKILDWLELGSRDSWALNNEFILNSDPLFSKGVYFFVLTGQDIDRKLYDHINSYTGEPGSDGVVRVASANLNGSWTLLEQDAPEIGASNSPLVIKEHKTADHVPFRILARKSHSNDEMGIMRSVEARLTDIKNADTITAILKCIAVKNEGDYKALRDEFYGETFQVQQQWKVETEERAIGKKYYIHDRHAMIVFKVKDSEGHTVHDFDLLLTAGPQNDPDDLPPGFFTDRQCNSKDQSTLTYYFNYDVMNGCEAVVNEAGTVVRDALPGVRSLGLTVTGRPDKGLVRYLPAVLPASGEHFQKLLIPNATTLVEIVLKRMVSTEVLQLEKMDDASGHWRDPEPGDQYLL